MIDELKKLKIVKSHYAGKVRDVFDLGEQLLIITSDRISAYDCVFPNIIPGKGKILNQISVFFFKNISHIIDNHLISNNVDDFPAEFHDFKDQLDGRSVLVKKSKVIPFECIARGYISGSAWEEYKHFGTVNSQFVDKNMKQSQRFTQPLFTPSTKAASGHDENISYNKLLERIDKNIAEYLKEKSLELYKWAHQFLLERDIIIADTKFEFGSIGENIILIDEIFTPDSSRFWDKNAYEIGISPKSYDKQFIRDFVTKSGWNKMPPAPELPQEVIDKSLEKYKLVYSKITGETYK
ncbi:MAG: phosphoribosylaminoimidazolesuccinocarboxamide synthase [Candidatus Cloacimonadales bacterium]|jgi:phosphoribosylaminoimidazole-succinocarboxamide synthase|nr:phosphoribosylaminoimidazolesuccinocarboxamide synthase [Candidatus Cloacimonadota bacterium]MDD2650065.1 phosphoribosylaminoimidazolesuccinocarboxamide synthase [Candidatus Cloacimonadota bacterium]MDD3501711.1 phosphoribosylaminoimidazolesuccinocarboxamide synthase [Candidatus Cloacimonadota bacterium]MDX9977136.1 phosphoribosylaminoimidazolesuccinocarboxamide synthase [Candidatus Cloacimonadales bacterium]